MGMEQDLSHKDELAARREAMRERLRAKCEKIIAAVEALPEPKTYLEAERAARMVILADKMAERVFSEPKVAQSARVKARSQSVSVDRAFVAPIVAFGLARNERFTGSFAGSSPLHCAVNSYVKGEDEFVNDPIVTSSPMGFAALRGTNDSLDRSLAHPPAAQGRIKGASAEKQQFCLERRKVLKSGASSVVIGAKRPDLVLKEFLKGLGP